MIARSVIVLSLIRIKICLLRMPFASKLSSNEFNPLRNPRAFPIAARGERKSMKSRTDLPLSLFLAPLSLPLPLPFPSHIYVLINLMVSENYLAIIQFVS